MANTSVSGLISGLDTATIISQLMQIEAQPQTSLKNRVTSEQKVVTALQGLNTKLAALFTSAGALGKASGWSAMTATSSNDAVTVTAGSSAVPATLDLTVNRRATASVLDLGTHALTDQVMADGSTVVSFTGPDGVAHDVDTGDGTYQGLVSAINKGGFGANATLVQVASGSYRVQIASAQTGAKSLSLAAPSGSTSSLTTAGTLTTGQQAWITVGTDEIYSDSNTFTGLMPGVDVTLGAGATGSATVTVGHDTAALSDSVKSMVDAVNSILSDIDKATAYNAASKTSGTLSGDSVIRDLRTKLLSAVSSGVGGQSLASVGIQTDRDGKLVFDATTFASAYAADPAGVQARFAGGTFTNGTTTTTVTTGFAGIVAAVADGASNSTSGSLTLAIQGHNSSIQTMNDSIAAWDVRLASKQTSLQRQYAALEVALGKLQDQSTWLAGQIKSLPTYSSGN